MGEHLQRVGVQAGQEVLSGGIGIGVVKEVAVLADLAVHAVVGIHPVNGCALDLPAVSGIAAPAVGIVGCQNFGNLAAFIRDAAGALDDVGTLQAALGAVGVQTLVFGNGLSQEVVPLDPEVTGEADFPGTGLGIVGIVLHLEGLALALGVVGNGQLYGVKNGHDPLGGLIQILPQAVLQERKLDGVGGLGNANPVTEVADGGGGVAPAAQAAEGGHSGIVPAGDIAVFHQGAELPFGEHRVINAQPGKLDLPGVIGNGDVLYHPVVQGAVVLKFQRAQRVGDSFQGVLDGVGKIVHGVDAPLVALTVMVHMANPVDHGVAHIEVAGGQVDFGAKGILVVLKLAGPHPGKQIQALLDGTVPIGGDGRGIQIAPVFLELLGSQLTDIGQALFDELHGILVVLLKVVGAIEEPVAPVKAQPVNVLLDGLYKLHILLGGVCVVHTQVAHAAELFGSTEVDDQGLAVADVQIAVGLRRKTGVHGFSGELPAGSNILLNKGMNEIFAFRDLSHIENFLSKHCFCIMGYYNRFALGLQQNIFVFPGKQAAFQAQFRKTKEFIKKWLSICYLYAKIESITCGAVSPARMQEKE